MDGVRDGERRALVGEGGRHRGVTIRSGRDDERVLAVLARLDDVGVARGGRGAEGRDRHRGDLAGPIGDVGPGREAEGRVDRRLDRQSADVVVAPGQRRTARGDVLRRTAATTSRAADDSEAESRDESRREDGLVVVLQVRSPCVSVLVLIWLSSPRGEFHVSREF